MVRLTSSRRRRESSGQISEKDVISPNMSPRSRPQVPETDTSQIPPISIDSRPHTPVPKLKPPGTPLRTQNKPRRSLISRIINPQNDPMQVPIPRHPDVFFALEDHVANVISPNQSHRHMRRLPLRSRLNSEDLTGRQSRMHSVASSASSEDILRHSQTPEIAEKNAASSSLPRMILRIYKSNGTYGTVACRDDTTFKEIIQLLCRKYFLEDPENYRIVCEHASIIHLAEPDSYVIPQMRREFLLHGYSPDVFRTLMGQEDLTYLGRFKFLKGPFDVLPPKIAEKFRQNPTVLELKLLSLERFPDYVMENAGSIIRLSLTRMSPAAATPEFARAAKNLRVLCLRSGLLYSRRILLSLEYIGTLRELDISCNAIRNLSFDFSNLPLLENLNISGNQLRTLPESLRTCPLKVLNASTNGMLDFTLYNPTLQVLNLCCNNIKSLAPDFANLSALTWLDLSHNHLQRVPPVLGKLRLLQYLNLCYNSMDGAIDSQGLSVTQLFISHNHPPARRSDGAVHVAQSHKEDLIQLPNLQHLEVTDCVFKSLASFAVTTLTHLDLTAAQILLFPDDIPARLTLLESLKLDNNSLAKLPGTINLMTSLRELTVSNNSLSSLPNELCDLEESLEFLDVHSNNLKQFPSGFNRMRNLLELNISSNLFDSLPSFEPDYDHEESQSSLYNTFTHREHRSNSLSDIGARSMSGSSGGYGTCRLLKLFAADNRLNDECFEDIRSIHGLEVLDLSYNMITEIPGPTFKRLCNLTEIHMAGNRISTLPQDEFEQLKNLRILILNGNRLHSLPAELSKAKNLEVLDVSSNNLRYNVSNWPFDWNWHGNSNLRYLNFSTNKRFEIKRTTNQTSSLRGFAEDFSSFTVLKKLTNLGLIDVTLTTHNFPEQSENCRVRTYGSVIRGCKFGIADSNYLGPVTINDMVIDRFRGHSKEAFVGIFDGQANPENSGNKISKLVQTNISSIFKHELHRLGDDAVLSALKSTFTTLHKEIGNLVLLDSSERPHSHMGHHSPITGEITNADISSGTGAVAVYLRDKKMYMAVLGGSQVIISKSNGEYRVLNEAHTLSNRSERTRVCESEGVVVNNKIAGKYDYTRLIGCYKALVPMRHDPSVYEYDISDPDDLIIIGTPELWKYVSYETTADVVRSAADNPVKAAAQLRDFALAYGASTQLCVMILSTKKHQPSLEMMVDIGKRRKYVEPLDTSLARLGSEVPPPFGDVSIIFTDIKDSTMLWETFPIVMRRAITVHNSVMRRAMRFIGGYEVKTEGDAFIVAFHNPVHALLWSLEVQQQLLSAKWPADLLKVPICEPQTNEDGQLLFRGLQVRMGIHWGEAVNELDPITGRMDYFGPMMNRASRISAIAAGGQILVSSDFLTMLNHYESRFDVKRMALKEPDTESDLPIHDATDFQAKVKSLYQVGYEIYKIGELKLKGIEYTETVYALYPRSIAGRAAVDLREDETETRSERESNRDREEPTSALSRPGSLLEMSRRSSAVSHGLENGSDIGEIEEAQALANCLIQVAQRLEQLCELRYGKRDPPQVQEFDYNHYILRIENATAALAMAYMCPNSEFKDILSCLSGLGNSNSSI